MNGGATTHVMEKKQDILMTLCCIPAGLLGIAFLIVNSPDRAFYYLSFFAIAGIRIPEKYLKNTAILLILITVLFTGVRAYGRPYLTKSEGEIEASIFIKQNLNGIVFTDQHFANILILNDYYDVQGISDNDKRTDVIYRENNQEKTKTVLRSLGADYIAITKRMREIYILSLNLPQMPMTNSKMYENNFSKIYDNGDVKIYVVPKLEIETAEQLQINHKN
jgi:hypothetical protein